MNLRPLLQNLYPAGTLQGQCVNFCHKLIDFDSVGDLYSQKKESVKKFGILKEYLVTFHIGDVVITNEGITPWQTVTGKGNGHAFFVADQDDEYLYAAESNFTIKERVTYGRKIRKDSKAIYGVIRGDFLFPIETKPLVLKVTFLMQYQKQWDSKVFSELCDRVKRASGGNVRIDPYPLYTYNSLKNWYYKYYGAADGNEFYKVVDQEYFDEQAMPLRFPDSHAVVWAINKDQWQGAVFNQPGVQEIGRYYPPTNPAQVVFSCDEKDMSPVSFGTPMFIDAVIHELCGHFLYTYGRKDQADRTHMRHFGQNGYPKDLNKIFEDFDFKRLTINL